MYINQNQVGLWTELDTLLSVQCCVPEKGNNTVCTAVYCVSLCCATCATSSLEGAVTVLRSVAAEEVLLLAISCCTLCLSHSFPETSLHDLYMCTHPVEEPQLVSVHLETKVIHK